MKGDPVETELLPLFHCQVQIEASRSNGSILRSALVDQVFSIGSDISLLKVHPDDLAKI